MRTYRQGYSSHISWFWILRRRVFAKFKNYLEVGRRLKKLPTNYEEVTSVWSKVTNPKTKG